MNEADLADFYHVYSDRYKYVELRHERRDWKPRPEVSGLVEERWSLARKKMPGLRSAPMLRLDEVVKRENRLIAYTRETDFKHYIGTLRQEKSRDRANVVYVSSRIVTSDNFMIIGLRANCAGGNGLYDIVSGAVHPVVDAIGYQPSLDLALYRAIQREAGLNREAIKGIRPRMMFGLKSDPVCVFLYDVELRIDSKQAMSKHVSWIELMSAYGMKPQMEKLMFLDNWVGNLRLESQQNYYRPIAKAVLTYLSRPNVYYMHAR